MFHAHPYRQPLHCPYLASHIQSLETFLRNTPFLPSLYPTRTLLHQRTNERAIPTSGVDQSTISPLFQDHRPPPPPPCGCSASEWHPHTFTAFCSFTHLYKSLLQHHQEEEEEENEAPSFSFQVVVEAI